MATVSVYKASFRGLIKLIVILLVMVSICLAIGIAFNHFDVHPYYLNFFEGVDFSQKNYLGSFWVGFFSLPFLLVLLLLISMSLVIIFLAVLDLGGYNG